MNCVKCFFFLMLSFVLIACNKTPEDVTLNNVYQDATGINVSWDESDDNKFNSYKLYQHISSGIDDLTGELIYVSTSTGDNSYTVTDFEPLQTYYYRVYVVNKKETSKGSNVLSVETETISLITNGSFESGNNIPSDWTLIQNDLNEPLNSIVIDNNTASDSINSLKFHHDAFSGCWEQWIEQNISLVDLSENGIYEFSFSYKSNQLITNGGTGFSVKNDMIDINIQLPTFSGDGNWHTFSSQFVLPENIGLSDPEITLHFCVDGVNDWWIDNISIIKI